MIYSNPPLVPEISVESAAPAVTTVLYDCAVTDLNSQDLEEDKSCGVHRCNAALHRAPCRL